MAEAEVAVLAKRIIPTMLVRGRTLVKGIAFDSSRPVGHAAQAAQIHSMRGVDELVLLDVAATDEGRGPDLDLVAELSETCFMPLAVGGGVRTLNDIQALLRAGADKVVIGTAAMENPALILEAGQRFGRQALVVAIDYRRGAVVVRCGKTPTDAWAVPYAQNLVFLGAGEILLTDIERDGTLAGYDLEMIKAVSHAVDIPVIAAGGAGTYEHMLQAIRAGADGVAAGAMFQFTDATPKGAAQYLQAHGVEVRL